MSEAQHGALARAWWNVRDAQGSFLMAEKWHNAVLERHSQGYRDKETCDSVQESREKLSSSAKSICDAYERLCNLERTNFGENKVHQEKREQTVATIQERELVDCVVKRAAKLVDREAAYAFFAMHAQEPIDYEACRQAELEYEYQNAANNNNEDD